MTPTPVLILLAAALGGCATSANKLPVCDGQHRRPANPYGSVLDPAPPPAVAATPMPASKPAAPPPAVPSPPGCG